MVDDGNDYHGNDVYQYGNDYDDDNAHDDDNQPSDRAVIIAITRAASSQTATENNISIS